MTSNPAPPPPPSGNSEPPSVAQSAALSRMLNRGRVTPLDEIKWAGVSFPAVRLLAHHVEEEIRPHPRVWFLVQFADFDADNDEWVRARDVPEQFIAKYVDEFVVDDPYVLDLQEDRRRRVSPNDYPRRVRPRGETNEACVSRQYIEVDDSEADEEEA